MSRNLMVSSLCFFQLLFAGGYAQGIIGTLPSGIFGEMGECLNAASDVSTALDCITHFTQCFDGAAIIGIFSCLQSGGANNNNNGDNITQQMEHKCHRVCHHMLSCVEEEIQAILNSLPTCLNSTVGNIGQCFVDNGATCNST
ncbi:unnamed protein product [Cylindrotheca closterium]|uniref:Uncharacterized protein n=1 Tax=Cylindrotheca closterium TaxID=2856 RepID=A0AAD2CRJ8_9STRA|nr:unnamed protein product [Cylindrotheca closterium]